MLYRLTACVALPLLTGLAAYAQAPTITGVVPAANARAVAPGSPLTVTFSQPLTASSGAALQVFGTRRGGRRTGAAPATVSGSSLTFAPGAFPYLPGETVNYSITTAAASSSGALTQGRVGQFTAAVGGRGTGTFQAAPDIALSANGLTPAGVQLGDLDNDGDLDLVVTRTQSTAPGGTGTVDVYLNAGRGTYAVSQGLSFASGINAQNITSLADVDGDGDLDVLVPEYYGGAVRTYLNSGTGTFAASRSTPVDGFPLTVTTGDVDGDGDLDLLTANNTSVLVYGSVSVRLNDGTGVFGGGQQVPTGDFPYDVTLGDIDGDGDLDFLASCGNVSVVSVRLNNGAGSFSGTQTVSVDAGPRSATLADVDGDGDLDLLTASYGNNGGSTVSVRLNNGSGSFGGGQNLATGGAPYSLQLSDLDHDGNPDLLVAGFRNGTQVSLNTGGTFGPAQGGAPNAPAYCLAAGDVDGDQDVDFVTFTNYNTLGVALNGGTTLAATAAASLTPTLFPNPAHQAATLAGAAPGRAVSVTDALGRQVLTTRTAADGTARLDFTGSLAPGLYLVRCQEQVVRLTVE